MDNNLDFSTSLCKQAKLTSLPSPLSSQMDCLTSQQWTKQLLFFNPFNQEPFRWVITIFLKTIIKSSWTTTLVTKFSNKSRNCNKSLIILTLFMFRASKLNINGLMPFKNSIFNWFKKWRKKASKKQLKMKNRENYNLAPNSKILWTKSRSSKKEIRLLN